MKLYFCHGPLKYCKMKKRSRKRDDAERRKVEKSVRELEQESGHVTLAQVTDLYPNVPQESQETILTLLNKPGDMINTTFLHTWYIKDKDTDVIYHGLLLKLKKTKKCTSVVRLGYPIHNRDCKRNMPEKSTTRGLELDTDSTQLYSSCIV